MFQILTGVVLSSVTLMTATTVGVQAYYKEVTETATHEFGRQRECLAMNIYHESRSESQVGQRAVAFVTLNRTKHDQYPDDVCKVVFDAVIKSDGLPKLHQCQFSWYCDGKPDEIDYTSKEWTEAEHIAGVVLASYGNIFDPTEGAIMYHAESVQPGWRKSYERTAQIDNHIFYREETE